jgi:hypothetical protein
MVPFRSRALPSGWPTSNLRLTLLSNTNEDGDDSGDTGNDNQNNGGNQGNNNNNGNQNANNNQDTNVSGNQNNQQTDNDTSNQSTTLPTTYEAVGTTSQSYLPKTAGGMNLGLMAFGGILSAVSALGLWKENKKV